MPLAARRPVAVALSTSMRSSHHDNHFDDDAALDGARSGEDGGGGGGRGTRRLLPPDPLNGQVNRGRVLLNNGEVIEPFCKLSQHFDAFFLTSPSLAKQSLI